MTSHFNSQQLANDHSLQLNNLLPKELCHQFITDYEKAQGDVTAINEIVQACAKEIFNDDVDVLLRQHFDGNYQCFWSCYNKINAEAEGCEYSTRWHLDYGSQKSLKLFVYLNPFAEHGGNTRIIDQARTESLREAGALPLEGNKRHDDLTEVLQGLGLETDTLAYDLGAGDALLFSPFILAHKCQPPKPDAERHTICFLLTPS